MSRHRFPAALCAVLLFLPAAAEAETAVGFTLRAVPSPERHELLQTALWYPAEADGRLARVAENPAFLGVDVREDATPLSGAHPLVVFSHGLGGNWRNEAWLATRLAAEGYVVAAPDHPGTTTFNRSKDEAADLSERPKDLSHVIDAVLGRPNMAGTIDPARIAVLGHSLGGWTAIEIAGGRFDAATFEKDCASGPGPSISCKAMDGLGALKDADHRASIAGDLGDPRVKAAVTLDLGPGRGFTDASLSAIEIPVLVLAAGFDVIHLPAERESQYLAEHLPQPLTTYRRIDDATHFSFMGVCKPGAADLIEKEAPGEGVVCRDGGTRSREEIHDEVFTLVSDFLKRSLQGAETAASAERR